MRINAANLRALGQGVQQGRQGFREQNIVVIEAGDEGLMAQPVSGGAIRANTGHGGFDDMQSDESSHSAAWADCRQAAHQSGRVAAA